MKRFCREETRAPVRRVATQPANVTIEHSITGSARHVVTRQQVVHLMMLAQGAYRQQQAVGLIDNGMTFDQWRKLALADCAPGKTSFNLVTQREYEKFCTWLQKLGGQSKTKRWRDHDARIAQRETNGGGDAHRARYVLGEKCRELAPVFGTEVAALDYARELLKRIHHVTLENATAPQLWATFYTLKSRASKKAAKPAAEAVAIAAPSVTPGEGVNDDGAPPRGVRADAGAEGTE